MLLSRVYLSFSLVLLLGVGACSKASKSKISQHEISALNQFNSPLGFTGKIKNEHEKESVESVNAIYYFLLGQRRSYEGSPEDALVAYERVRTLDSDSSYLHYVLAQEYLKKGMSTEGVAMARKALEINPKDRDAKLLLANLYATAKKYPEARSLFNELSAQNPDDEEVLLYLVLMEIEQKNSGEGFRRLKAYLDRNTESAVGYFYLGRILQEEKRNKEAIQAYQKAIEIRPGFVQAGTYLGTLFEELADRKSAIETFEWLAVATDNSVFHKKLGDLYLLNNEYEKALGAYQNFQRIDSSDLNNRVKVALLLTELKRFDEAVKVFQSVLKESPDSDNLRFYLASIYDQQGKNGAAQEEYSRIPFKSKLYPDALRYRVSYLRKNDRASSAWKLVEDALVQARSDKTHLEDVYEIGISYLDSTDQVAKAGTQIEEALKEFPESPRFMYLKGTLLEKLGKTDEAVGIMRGILSKDPQHAGAMNFIGYVWADREVKKHLAEAESYVRKALKLRPKDPFITDSLGWVLFKRGRIQEAYNMLKGAFDSRPDESVIAQHLGDVLVKMGKVQDAKSYYETALKLGPESDSDKKAIEAKLSKLPSAEAGKIVEGSKNESSPCAQPNSADCDLGLRKPRSPAQTH